MKWLIITFMFMLAIATAFVVKANTVVVEFPTTTEDTYKVRLKKISISSKKKGRNPIHVQKFFRENMKLCTKEQKVKGIPFSLKMSQAMIESSYGRSSAARNGNAYFCIKGVNSKSFKVYDKAEKSYHSYRGYESKWWSFRDHSNLLLNENYGWVFNDLTYDNYLKKVKSTNQWRKKSGLKPLDIKWKWSWSRMEKFEKIAHGIHASGYATDRNYSKKLIKIISRYKLNTLDT